jgi:hypothetical protein
VKVKLLKPRKPTWIMCAMANACQEELQIEGVDGVEEALAAIGPNNLDKREEISDRVETMTLLV